MSPGAGFLSIFLPQCRNFAKIFCPGAGNLTTLKKFPKGQPGEGGCWCLELTDALIVIGYKEEAESIGHTDTRFNAENNRSLDLDKCKLHWSV